MFRQTETKAEKGLTASYEISKLIAKTGKPHNIGETLILPAVTVVVSTVMSQNANEIIQVILLGNSTVSRRIDEMADDVEDQLVAKLQVHKFAIQIDETNTRNNEAILMTYVRFLKEDDLHEEMLFARKLITDTKGETIFEELQNYFKEHNIPLKT